MGGVFHLGVFLLHQAETGLSVDIIFGGLVFKMTNSQICCICIYYSQKLVFIFSVL